MLPTGYSLLLLFCILTNMTHSMGDFTDLTQKLFNLQTQKEAYNPWEWNSTNSNETNNNPILSPRKITTPEELMSQQNTSVPFDNLFEQDNPFSLDSTTIFSDSDNIFSEFEFSNQGYFTFPEKSSSSSDIFAESSSSSTWQFPLPSENINDFVDLTQQTFMDFTRQIPDSDSEEFSNSENMFYQFKNIDVLQQTSSLSRQQIEEQQKILTTIFNNRLQKSLKQHHNNRFRKAS